MVWFRLVLLHINRCWLFNAKSCFYIYIKYKLKQQILEVLCIRNKHPKLNKINFESSANVLKCLQLLLLFIE